MQAVWGDFEECSAKMKRYYKVENQAGERVGVAKAPRLSLQRTATPTAREVKGSKKM